MKSISSICFAAVLLTTASAHAQGVVLVEQETRDGKTSENQMQMDKTHMRVESSASGRRTAFVYDAGAGLVRIINLDQKSYMEIDKAQLEQIRTMVIGLQEKLKGLPPEQREMMDKMMRGRGMGVPASRPQFKQIGTDTVGKWPCTKYEATVDGAKTMELCAAEPKTFGLNASDFDVARQLGEFVRSMAPQLADQAIMFGTSTEQGFSGIPVRRTMFTDGKATSVSEVKEFKRAEIPSTAWEVPAGFRRETMMGGR